MPRNENTIHEPLYAQQLEFTEEEFILHTGDGAHHRFPWRVSPRLLLATPAKRASGVLMPGGGGIEWEALDEHLSVQGLLDGRISGENWRSVVRWLALREAEAEAKRLAP